MTRPKAYDPQPDTRYQLLLRTAYTTPEWEHLDYADDTKEKNSLITHYNQLYFGGMYEIKVIMLPRKYWPKKEKLHALPTQVD